MDPEGPIVERLRDIGDHSAATREGPPTFVEDESANALLTDLDRYPHAFVVGCICDRQVRAERAWRVPMQLRDRLGTFEFADLIQLPEADILAAFSTRPALHRLPKIMGRNVYASLKHIEREYGGDAARLWSDQPTSAGLVYRFLVLPGIGPKIATMAANILVRGFGIEVRDRYSIDISVDRHVRRVMTRLGLVESGASVDAIIYRARSIPYIQDSLTSRPSTSDVSGVDLNGRIAQPARCMICVRRPRSPTTHS